MPCPSFGDHPTLQCKRPSRPSTCSYEHRGKMKSRQFRNVRVRKSDSKRFKFNIEALRLGITSALQVNVMKRKTKGQAAFEYIVTTCCLLGAVWVGKQLFFSNVDELDNIRLFILPKLIRSNEALRQPIP